MEKILKRQHEFQKLVGFPIDSILEEDRNAISEKYIFKLIEEAIELRREFPSVMNPWSKEQKPADFDRIQSEIADVFLFFCNILLTWKVQPDEFLDLVEDIQSNNFLKVKEKKMNILNSEILAVPGHTVGIGSGNLSPKVVFIGQNPGKGITHGYKFWSNPEDGSSKILLPLLEGIQEFCYFTNIVKSTTVDNKEPTDKEVEFWMPFLERELDILKVDNIGMKVISLGSFARDRIKADASVQHPAVVLRGSRTLEEYKNTLIEALGDLYV